MWKRFKKWVSWLKYRYRHGLWWNAKEKVRQVYNEAKGNKSYMIEIKSGKAIYENKESMERQIQESLSECTKIIDI